MKPLERVKANLQILKMKAGLEKLPELLTKGAQGTWSTLQVLDKLLDEEVRTRKERRIERRFKESRLPEKRTLDQFDFDFQKGYLDRNQIMLLATLEFIRQGLNVIFSGKSGTGKSHISMALALLACYADYRVRYTTCAQMLVTLFAALADHSLPRWINYYAGVDLLVIDDLGTEKVEILHGQGASLFFKVINKRYGKASTIITSNIETDAWNEYFGDPCVTVSALDRFTHFAIPIVINGPSYRVHLMEKRLQEQNTAKGTTRKRQKKGTRSKKGKK